MLANMSRATWPIIPQKCALSLSLCVCVCVCVHLTCLPSNLLGYRHTSILSPAVPFHKTTQRLKLNYVEIGARTRPPISWMFGTGSSIISKYMTVVSNECVYAYIYHMHIIRQKSLSATLCVNSKIQYWHLATCWSIQTHWFYLILQFNHWTKTSTASWLSGLLLGWQLTAPEGQSWLIHPQTANKI